LNIISEATKEGVKVIFRDTGCGITPQQQTMLLPRFLLQKPKVQVTGLAFRYAGI